MLIRLGYEIAIECPHHTPVISLLEIHPDRQADIKRQSKVLTSPQVASSVYTDMFGNGCRRFMAPGRRLPHPLRRGHRGQRRTGRGQHAGQRRPRSASCRDECSAISARQPLLRDRPAERSRLAAVRPPSRRLGARPGDRDYVHNRLSFGYGYARSTRTAAQAHEERVGVCRDFAHLAITLCRCMNIPARYCNGYLGDIGVPPIRRRWISRPGSRPISAAAGTRSTPATTAAHRPHRHGARAATPPTCRCCTRSARTACAVQGLDLRAGKPSRNGRPCTGSTER